MSAGAIPSTKDLPEYDITVRKVPERDGAEISTGWRAESDGHDVTAKGDTATDAVDVLLDAIGEEEIGLPEGEA